jgi:hypothetical protein
MSYRWRRWRDRERLEKRRWSWSETSSRTMMSSCSLPRRTKKGTMQGITLGVFCEIEEESERSDASEREWGHACPFIWETVGALPGLGVR